MSLIPALDADCTSIILDHLDNSALSAFACTSHAAVVPMRLRLSRSLHFTGVGSAITGLTFVQNHSLVHAVRAVIFGMLKEGWVPPLVALIADVLAFATNLMRFHAKEFAELVIADPRVTDIVVSSKPGLMHLHLHGLLREDLEDIQGVRGIRPVTFGVQDNDFKIDCAKYIAAIISGNALRLDTDVSPCLLVSRPTLHNLAFLSEEVGRVFPNIQQQHLWRTNIFPLEKRERLGPYGPPLARALMLPVPWYHDFASLRSLVIQTTMVAFHVEALTALLRQSPLRDLSLSQVSIGRPQYQSPPSDIGIATYPLLSNIVSNANSLRRLDMRLKFNIPYDPVFVVPHATFRVPETSELTYLSISVKQTVDKVHVDRDLFLAIFQAWFRSLPTLAYMRVEIDFIETRWKRRCPTSGTGSLNGDPRSIIVPYDKRGSYIPIPRPEYEDKLYSVKDDETCSLTARYIESRRSQDWIDHLRSNELEEFTT
ncbi:hypothetical protein EVG20_g8676 [Dentipellis fragilis]|uniref:F-box domain-containing protein n=1 Tax=Dentipellis fragilis TaxID=205917 RepID=A0A4Y9Y402_9AGAM|nr:hypothetical protein EVG20_g8676 [Dentipellis fragilis]